MPHDAALLMLEEDSRLAFHDLVAHVHEITEAAIAPVHTEPEAHDLNELLMRGKKALKRVEDRRKLEVVPLNDQVRTINDLFRPLSEALGDFEKRAKAVLLAYRRAKDEEIRKAREEAERKSQEARIAEAKALLEAEQAKTKQAREEALARAERAQEDQQWAALAVPTQRTGVRTESGVSSIRKRWTFRVINEVKIPRQYLTINEQALNAAIRAGVREIPGCEIYQEDDLSARTR